VIIFLASTFYAGPYQKSSKNRDRPTQHQLDNPDPHSLRQTQRYSCLEHGAMSQSRE